ncbi:3-dehydroquinate synthase [Clostridium sp. cel8]|uniref:3-dehydroquinate synthase n=1 Tax=unclassified Clostridium TaxID=2614128 RepID=UPI001A9B9BAA|nr:3-dehydroquinate synthase [Clostridium sp. cel8]
MKEIDINLKNDSYKVYIESDLKELYNLLKKYKENHNMFLITDDIVGSIYSDIIDNLENNLECKVFKFNHGEENKSIDTVKNIYDFLLKNGANRNSILIGLGGGLVGDIVGFAASTYMRGIKFINIPTTMLSQIDSCIGGKVGYNYDDIKNLIGSFFNPEFVYVCPSFLKSLNDMLFRDGLGELVKYCLIDSKEFLNYVNDNFEDILKRDEGVLIYIIERCLNIKKDVVTKDFKDTGLRNILNFGHTIGHGIEICSNFNISHGEAVGLGSLAALKLSEYKFNMRKDIYPFVKELIKKLGLPISYKIEDYEAFLYAVSHDKKNDSSIRFVLLQDIGNYKIKVDTKKDEIVKAIRESIDL